jgi:hypothetical protein
LNTLTAGFIRHLLKSNSVQYRIFIRLIKMDRVMGFEPTTSASFLGLFFLTLINPYCRRKCNTHYHCTSRTGGALRATLLHGFNIENVKYIATTATIALVTDATRIPVYISQGYLTEQYYYLYLPVLSGIALGPVFVSDFSLRLILISLA